MIFYSEKRLKQIKEKYNYLWCIEPDTFPEEEYHEVDLVSEWEGTSNQIKRDLYR